MTEFVPEPVAHPCEVAPSEFDHDMEYIEDEIGDPGVINGTYVERFYRCRNCGHEEACEAGDYGPDYDDFL